MATTKTSATPVAETKKAKTVKVKFTTRITGKHVVVAGKEYAIPKNRSTEVEIPEWIVSQYRRAGFIQ